MSDGWQRQAEWMRLRPLLPTEVGLSRPAAKERPAPSPHRQRSGRRRATVGAIQTIFRTASPARLGAGEEQKEGAAPIASEFTRPVPIYGTDAVSGYSPIRTKMGTRMTRMLRNADLRRSFF